MNLPKSFEIRTPRLRLRLPSPADYPHIFSATRFPGFNDGMLWEPPASEAELEAPYQSGLLAWEQGKGYGFAIELLTDQTFVGRISIRKTAVETYWNLGFWTHPRSQGQGYMTEAVQAVIQLGFQELEAETIDACYATWNKASEKVLTKNGLQFVEYLEKGFQKRGEWVAENRVAIGRAEWMNKPSTNEH